jgi:hypothetical protein
MRVNNLGGNVLKVELEKDQIYDLIYIIEKHLENEGKRKFDRDPGPFSQTIEDAGRKYKGFENLKKYLSNKIKEG